MSSFLRDGAPSDPYVFVQYKGTDLCIDFHCECGAHCHYDGDFAYAVKCPHCGTVWEMPCYIVPRKADDKTNAHWRENPKELLPDDDFMDGDEV